MEKKYKKMMNGYIFKQSLFIVLDGLAMAAAVLFIKNTFIAMGIVMLCTFLAFKVRKLVISEYRGILEEQCNPKDYLGFYSEYEKRTHSYYGKIVCNLEIAKAMYYMGNSAEALCFLSSKISEEALMPQELILYYNLIANCYFHRGDLESLGIIEKKFDSLSLSPEYPPQIRGGFAQMKEFVGTSMDILKNNLESADRGIRSFENPKATMLQKVCNSYRNACLHLLRGETKEAAELLRFVKKNGNGVYHVKLAEEKLKEISHNK